MKTLNYVWLMIVVVGLWFGPRAGADVIYLDDFAQFPDGTQLMPTNYLPVIGATTAISTNPIAGQDSATVTAAVITGNVQALIPVGIVPYAASYRGTVLTGAQTNSVLSLSFLLRIRSLQPTNHLGGFSVGLLTTNGLQTSPLIWLNDDGQVYLFTNSPAPQTGITVGNWGSLADTSMTNLLVLNYPAGRFAYSLNSRVLTNLPLPALFTNIFDRIGLDVAENVTNAGVASLGNEFALDDVQLNTAAGSNQNVVTYIAAAKGTFYDQTNAVATAVVSNGFVFTAQVHATGSNTVLSALDQTPGGTMITLPQTTPTGTAFDYQQTFISKAALDTAFPAGIYSLTISTRDQGAFIPALQLPGDAYPNAPQIANFDAARMIDSTNDFVLTWTAFSGGTTQDLISVEIADDAGNPVFTSPDFGMTGQLDGTATSILIPAGTLAPAMTYTGTVAFMKFPVRDTNSIPDVVGVAGYFKSTQFPVGTVTTGACSYALSATNAVFSPGSTNGTVSVWAPFACPWTATNNDAFITITGVSIGIGTGTVQYAVAANSTADPRQGTLTIAGITFTVDQATAGCSETINPPSAAFTAAGGTGSVAVVANGTNCSWTAASNAGFITLTSTNAGTGAGTITYTVDSNATFNARNGTILIASNRFTVAQAARVEFADLAVTKNNLPATVYLSSNLTYTITIKNLGPDIARAVACTDPLPASVSYVVATTTQGTVYRTANTVTGDIGAMASGASVVVTITVIPTVAEVLTNTLTVTTASTDTNTSNNTATAIATAIPALAADLGVSSVVAPNPVFYGSNLTYSVTVVNNGPATATGVVLTHNLPAGASFVTATTSQGTWTQVASRVVCQLDSLPARSNATARVTVLAATLSNLCSLATVSGTLPDPVVANNAASVCASVEAHDLAVVKIKAPQTVRLTAGKIPQTKTVRVTIQNRSPVNEQITGATISNLVTLVVTSLHTNSPCPAPVPVLHVGSPQRSLPVTLKPKQKFTVIFDVPFACATDPLKNPSNDPTRNDFSYTATVHHEALDNRPDADTADNTGPRGPLPYPDNLDPFPNGKIRDLGCGGKYPDGTLGAPVTTDVIDSR